MRPRVLYLSVNDGSDTRINKEIRTLARQADVHFLGVAQESTERAFVREHCASCTLVHGRRKSVLTLARLWGAAMRAWARVRPDSTQVINEDLALVFLPLLAGQRHVVLDVFDSFFLRQSLPAPARTVLQRSVYGVAQRILATDTDRAELMPGWCQAKVRVLENFPYAYQGSKPARAWGEPLRIYVNGSIARCRGTDLVQGLLGLAHGLEVTMAGWLYDDHARALRRHPRVKFLGTVTQQRSMELSAEADYIFCLYEPNNRNNILASPNKVYDAIQAETPVIINRETRVSRFVKRHGLGVVLDSFYERDFEKVYAQLEEFRLRFRVPPEFKARYTWEAVEGKLLEAHGLTTQD